LFILIEKSVFEEGKANVDKAEHTHKEAEKNTVGCPAGKAKP
jgi:hypothetical protein